MRWILLAVLLAVGAAPARAQLSSSYCRFYFGEEEYISPEVLEVLNWRQGNAVRLCTRSSWTGPADYDLFSPPVRGAFDVCQVTQRQLSKDGETFSLARSEGAYPGEPKLLMMASAEDCPRQDDRRYIAATDVSAGVFATLARFWKEMSSSEEGREALLANFSSAVRSSSEFQELESAFKNGELELMAVSLDTNVQETTPYYELTLGKEFPSWSLLASWSLLVDFVDDELVVLGYGTIVY